MGLIYDFHGDKNLIDEQQLVLGFLRALISWRLISSWRGLICQGYFFMMGVTYAVFIYIGKMPEVSEFSIISW